MARGRPFVVGQVAFGLACVLAGSQAAFGQTRQDRPGIHLGLPSLNILGLVKTSPTSIDLGSQGLNATLPSINAAGVVTTNSATIGVSAKGATVILPEANVVGVVTTTSGSVNLDAKGATVILPGANVAGDLVSISNSSISLNDKGLSATTGSVKAGNVLSVAPTSVSASTKGINATVGSLDLAGVVTTTPTSVSLNSTGLNATVGGIKAGNLLSVAPTSVSVGKDGVNATVGSLNVAGVITTTPTSLSLNDKGLNATVGSLNVAGAITTSPLTLALDEKGLSASGGSVTVGGVKTPAVNVNVGGQSLWTMSGKDVINYASPVTQMFAITGNAEAFSPVDQLLNGLAFGNDAPSNCANVDANALAPPPTADIANWNAITIGRTSHDGYNVTSENGVSCGSTFGFQTTERAQLPGVLWDASSAFGLRKGSFHLGFSVGASDSDTQMKATAALRDAGIAQAGSMRMQSYAINGFSLYTSEKWYAGTAFGSAWGRTESQNLVMGSESDYDTSTFVAAGFLGTIIPLTDTVRFDLRGTLSYQRTVGEAHVDSLGLVYGDHAITAADAMFSGRVFGVFRLDDMTIRPFIQAGITHHINYSNNLEIDGIAFTLEEADTSRFAAAGLDFEIDRTLQLSVGVRHDRSPDYESITGRFGLTWRLN